MICVLCGAIGDEDRRETAVILQSSWTARSRRDKIMLYNPIGLGLEECFEVPLFALVLGSCRWHHYNKKGTTDGRYFKFWIKQYYTKLLRN